MQFDIITIFPKIFDSYFSESILKRAQAKGKIKINIHDLRENAVNKYGQVDDKPYGGGPGMVLMFEPIYKTLQQISPNFPMRADQESYDRPRWKTRPRVKTILLSAKGKTLDQQVAKRYAKLDQLIMICGHYEGIDERIINFIDEEISIGDYVLTGGELPAMVVTDAVARLVPGVLGKDESSQDESHSKKGSLEYPQYTRPEKIVVNKKTYSVPEVLLSGNHQKIAEWREKNKKIKK